MHVVGTHYHVDPRRLARHQFTVLLSEAAGNNDLAPLALVLPGAQPAERAVQLVVGVLANAARVEHYDICIVLVGDCAKAICVEQPRDALRVVFIHLTPKGVHDVVTAHGNEG